MTDASGNAVHRFEVALDKLHSKAGRPTAQHLSNVTERGNKQAVPPKTIQGWLGENGAARVIPRKGPGFTRVIEYLLDRAGTPEHKLPQSRADLEKLRADAQRHRTTLSNVSDVAGRTSAPTLLPTSLYLRQVREFIDPIDGLHERETELAMLAEFCRGNEPYLWVRAEPWAGKSALLASFVLNPPPDITAVGFFITDRLAAQNDHNAFTVALLDQLAALLPDQRARIESATHNLDGLRNELLVTAAEAAAAAGRRLVLIVDGLDEDIGTPSIVGLLPTRPPESLRIVVASRHGPEQPVPQHHPVARAKSFVLASSPFAADIRVRAVAELDAMLNGPVQHRDLLSLVVAAHGLSVSELADLTTLAPYEIDRLLVGVTGRSFRSSPISAALDHDRDRNLVYVLAHDTLQRTAELRLGTRLLDASVAKVFLWAERSYVDGWPAETPDFLFRRYFAMLERNGDRARMIALALDSDRHERMYAHTGTDWAALTEIRTIQEHIRRQPDRAALLSMARLARHRDNLHSRNDNIPARLPALLARLGQADRAEALVQSIGAATRRISASTDLAKALADTDPERVVRLTANAEADARGIGYERGRAKAIAQISEVIAATDPARAEALVSTIADPKDRRKALARVAETIAPADPDHALTLAETVSDPEWRAELLARLADAIRATDPVRARRFAADAEARVRAAPNWPQPDKLARVASLVAYTDPDRAETMAREITDQYWRAAALAKVAAVIASTSPDRAIDIARDLPAIQRADALTVVATAIATSAPERAAEIMTDSSLFYPTDATIPVAAAMAPIDPDRARPLAEAAETLAHAHPDKDQRADMLCRVAEVFVHIDPDHACQLADNVQADAYSASSAVQLAYAMLHLGDVVATSEPALTALLLDLARAVSRNAGDSQLLNRIMARITRNIATATPSDRAESLVDMDFYDQSDRTSVVEHVAEMLAAADPPRAETFAQHLTNPAMRVTALVRVAHVVAGTEPHRARRLTDHAWDIANNSVSVPWERDRAIGEVAEAVAVIEPHRAETIFAEIADIPTRVVTMTRVAETIAFIDPTRAYQLAQAAQAAALDSTDYVWHNTHLVHLAGVFAAIDPERAEAIANIITDPRMRASALGRLASATVSADQADVVTSHSTHESAGSRSMNTDRSSHHRAVRLLTQALTISPWYASIGALYVVDPRAFDELVSDLISESS